MEYKEIDYTKLNEKIVSQAQAVLTNMQVKELIEGKIARAEAVLKEREVFARGSKYSSC
jgi:hypothetical protein